MPLYDILGIGRLIGGGIVLLSPGIGILIGGGGNILLPFKGGTVIFDGGGIFIGGTFILFY